MEKLICNLNMTVTEIDDNTKAEGDIEFHGTILDKAEVLAHVFTIMECSEKEALHLALLAVSIMREEEAKTE